jgi:hypothetical protein
LPAQSFLVSGPDAYIRSTLLILLNRGLLFDERRDLIITGHPPPYWGVTVLISKLPSMALTVKLLLVFVSQRSDSLVPSQTGIMTM